ncbi:hypothetical protein N2152v2_005135 [Parachlorella kessleri]
MRAAAVLACLFLASTLTVGRANIVDVATGAGLNYLIAAVQYAGLSSAVTGFTSGTILAPTDAAFRKAFAELNVTSPTEVPAALVAEVLSYHVIPQTIKAAEFTDGEELEPLGPPSATITVSVADGNVVFEPSSGITPATVIVPDVAVPGTDVIVHVIDEVLIPIEVAEMVGLV